MLLMLGAILLLVLTVPLLGGRLAELADLRLRGIWMLALSFLLQVAILLAVPKGAEWLHPAVHLASYLLAGAFLVRNRQIPGAVLVLVGGVMNFAAIAANGGAMPITRSAAAMAGFAQTASRFQNALVTGSPRLSFLSDVFAVPGSVPFHNTFSIGDLIVLVGVAVLLHRVCGSVLGRGSRNPFGGLTRNRDFMLVWGSQAASNLGDWAYTLAVASTLSRRGFSPGVFATVLILQVGPSSLVSFLGGPLMDRHSRKGLMVASDLVRMAAVGSLLFGPTPSAAHFYAVAVVIGVGNALFMPSLHASVPNLVPPERLVAANSVIAGTFNVAVMVGPVIGALLVMGIGVGASFALNAASFGVSAALLAGVHLRQGRSQAAAERPLAALAGGLRHINNSRLLRGIFLTLGLVMIGAAIKAPLEPLFITHVLSSSTGALGLAGTAWGAGMVMGSLLSPSAAVRWPRERLLAVSIFAVGLAVAAASLQHSIWPVLALWLVAGCGNGLGTVAYETLLQERTPDEFRGRVMAAAEALLDGSFLVGALAAGMLGGILGVRAALALSGSFFLAGSLAAASMLGRDLGSPEPGRSPLEPAPEPVR